MRINPLTQTDFYKTGHIFQYPEGTTEVYSNLTARSSKLARVIRETFDEKIVWFGLQGFIKHFLIEVWNEGFFNRPKDEVVREYKRRLDTSLGPDAVPVEHIAQLHDIGYLPIEIKSLPEGSRVNVRVPVLTIRNTRPEAYWAVNYLETVKSNMLWKPATVATLAFEYRRILTRYAKMTGAPEAFIDWQGHDFSCRGLSGYQDALSTGAAHLLSFYGTDTIAAIDYLEAYYNANCEQALIGGSVPATEHSVMCMGGEDDEIGTFRRLITKIYPSGVVSIVSDTWDFFRVITEYARELRPQILARTPNAMGLAKVVFRPDSGDPVKILTGYNIVEVDNANDDDCMREAEEKGAEAVFDRRNGKCFTFQSYDTGWTTKFELKELSAEEAKGAVQCLWDVFGGTMTDAGYMVLNERVGLIYGDSITLERAEAILSRLEKKGFASNNVVFGIGSYSYQGVTRDTFGWAVKATSGVVKGERRALSKNPKTDSGVKKSARGLLRVEQVGKDFVLYDDQTEDQEAQGALRTVFKDGVLLIDEDLETIRRRLRES